MKKILAIVVALLFAPCAYAQNPGTLTSHAFAIGKGPNVTGYTSLLCTSAQLAVGQAAADPICRTMTGDATLSAAGALALATVSANVGTFGGVNSIPSFTVDGKGRITAAAANVPAIPFTELTGSLACGQTPAYTGDATKSAGSCATVLATVNANVGTFGSTTQCITATVNAKGLITAISQAACAGGGSGAPGGTSGQVQWNSAGTFAGFTLGGDATLNTGTGALTLATVSANVGAFGSATTCVTVTNNAKGLTTAISAVTCTPAIASITGMGTGVATALAVNVGTAGAFVVNGGAGGTPSSITLTNGAGLPATGLTGTLQAAQEPAHTGDVTNSAGSLAMALATVNANVGSFGSATNCVSFTTNAKGLITAASQTTCTPAIASVTGLGTGVATALGVNVGTAGSVVVNGGALGTPSSGNGSNLTNLNGSNVSSGTVPVANGGTGATSLAGIQAALGLYNLETAPITVNFGIAGDYAITVPMPTGATQFRANGFMISQCSASLAGATFGVFTATGGGGAGIVTAGAASAVTNNTANTNNNFQFFNTIVNGTTMAYTPAGGAVQFRVGATVSATCQISMFYTAIP